MDFDGWWRGERQFHPMTFKFYACLYTGLGSSYHASARGQKREDVELSKQEKRNPAPTRFYSRSM